MTNLTNALGNLAEVKKLVGGGLFSKKNPVNEVDPFYRKTTLMIAAENGHLDIVEYLVNAGADVNWTLRSSSILDSAIHKGHIPVVRYLVEVCKMDVNHVEKSGFTPLMAATRSCRSPRG